MSQVVVNSYWFVSAAGPDGTQNYVPVTIQASQVPSALTDYPAYVRMSDLPAAFWSSVQADGGDIRVTEDDGTTRAPVDLVSIDTGASTGELHFKASSVSASSNTTYRVYYNATSTLSQPAVGDTYGRNAVWSDYAGVWHMHEDPSGTAPQMIDATGNGNDGTTEGSMTSGDSVAAQLGNGLEFDGVDDGVKVSDSADTEITGTEFTVTLWYNPLHIGEDTLEMLLDQNDLSLGGNGQWYVAYENRSATGSGNEVRMAFPSSDPGTPLTLLLQIAGGWTNGTWYHLAFVIDDGSHRGYRDAVQEDTETDPVDTAGNSLPLAMGKRSSSSGNEANERLDEVRIRKSALTSGWVSAEHTNQDTPATFYSVGSEQAA